MKRLRSVFCLVAAFAPAPVALAQTEPLKQPGRWAQDYLGRPADPAVRFGTLPNGLRYAIMRNDTPKAAVSMRMVIGSGSLKERDEERGLAHFLEHMAFRGSTNVPDGEVVHMLERHGLRFGPDTNAFTAHDRTVYMFNFPQATPEALDTGFKLFREIGERLTMASGAVEAEKGVVLSEERLRDTPGYKAMKRQIELLLAGTRAPDRIPIGTVETIKAATPERLKRYYRANYRPENATIVVVGAIDVDRIEAAIKTGFSGWKSIGPADQFEPQAPAPVERVAELVADGAPDELSLNWVGSVDRRASTLAVEREKLARSLAARVLNNRLSDRSLRPGSPFMSAQFSVSDAVFGTASASSLGIQTDPAKWRAALDAVMEEQRMLRRDGVTQAELDRAKNPILSALQSAVDGAATRRSEGLADGLASAALDGGLFTSPVQVQAQVREMMAGMTPDVVTTALRTALNGGAPLVFRSAHAEAATPAILQTAVAAAQDRTLPVAAAPTVITWPYADFGAPGTILSRTEDPALGITIVTFANGTRLIAKQTDFTKNSISVSAGFGTGQAGLPVELVRATWASNLFAAGGTEKLGTSELRQWLQTEGKVIGFGSGLSTKRFVLSGGTRPADLLAQMQLVTAFASAPGFRPEMTQQLATMGAMIKTQMDTNPGAVYSRDLNDVLNGFDKRFKSTSNADIDATQPGDVAVMLRPLLVGPADVIIVGDVPVEEAIRVTAATLGAVKRAPRPAEPAVRISMPAGREEPYVFRHGGRADQAIYGLVWPMPDFFTDPKLSVTADVAAALIKARLTDTVREKLGLTYSPGAGAFASMEIGGMGYLTVQTETPPDKFAAMRTAVMDVIIDLTRNPISADELERARKPLVEAAQKQRETNGFWVSVLGQLLREPRGHDQILDEPKILAAVTVQDVQTLLAQHIASKKPLTAISQAR